MLEEAAFSVTRFHKKIFSSTLADKKHFEERSTLLSRSRNAESRLTRKRGLLGVIDRWIVADLSGSSISGGEYPRTIGRARRDAMSIPSPVARNTIGLPTERAVAFLLLPSFSKSSTFNLDLSLYY